MKEHMDVPIDTSNMSEQELQFHYFKMHDSDGNNKLGNVRLHTFWLKIYITCHQIKLRM